MHESTWASAAASSHELSGGKGRGGCKPAVEKHPSSFSADELGPAWPTYSRARACLVVGPHLTWCAQRLGWIEFSREEVQRVVCRGRERRGQRALDELCETLMLSMLSLLSAADLAFASCAAPIWSWLRPALHPEPRSCLPPGSLKMPLLPPRWPRIH